MKSFDKFLIVVAFFASVFAIYSFVSAFGGSETGQQTNSSARSNQVAMVEESSSIAQSTMEPQSSSMAENNSNTIVDKAIELEMNTLVEAVQAAELVETLSSEGPFTVFVPTQQAFDNIAATLEQIKQAPDAKDQLANILTYHVVAGKVMAADVVKLHSATTVQGSDVKIMTEGANVMINDANVIQTDVEVSNGVIHLIDKVLIPHTN